MLNRSHEPWSACFSPVLSWCSTFNLDALFVVLVRWWEARKGHSCRDQNTTNTFLVSGSDSLSSDKKLNCSSRAKTDQSGLGPACWMDTGHSLHFYKINLSWWQQSRQTIKTVSTCFVLLDRRIANLCSNFTKSFKNLIFNFSHFSALPILISYLIELETSELNVKLLHSFEWNKGRKINGNSKILFLFYTDKIQGLF